LLEGSASAKVARNVAGSAHKDGVPEVLAHELLDAQEQEARGEKDRAQEVLQMVQSANSAQRNKKVNSGLSLLRRGLRIAIRAHI
jgi:hypothetical protein